MHCKKRGAKQRVVKMQAGGKKKSRGGGGGGGVSVRTSSALRFSLPVTWNSPLPPSCLIHDASVRSVVDDGF